MMNYNELINFKERMENAENWSDIEAKEYSLALDSLGLDYSTYDDPDFMYEDFVYALEHYNK